MSALLFLCVAAGLWNTSFPGDVKEVGAFEREIVFEDVVACEGPEDGAELRNVEIRFATPLPGVGQTLLRPVAPTFDAAASLADPHGNRVFAARAERLKPGELLRATWSVRVRLADRVYDVDRASLPPSGGVPVWIGASYLGGGGKHVLTDPALRAEAEAIRRSATDAYDLAFKLNEAVRARLTYDRDGKWDDAATVWKTGRGSCSEYHFVYASLCRLAGLPCRFVGATAWRGKRNAPEAVDTVYHRWSEVWMPGFGWFPVDVSRNDGEDGKPINRAFGRIERGLLVVTRADGGDDDPLGSAYLATMSARRSGGAKISHKRSATWRAFDPTESEAEPATK